MTRLLVALAALACHPAPLHADPVSPEEQRRALTHSIALVEQRYVATERVEAVVEALAARRSGISGPVEGEALARDVTALLRSASGDGHLGLSYSREPIADPEDHEPLSLADDFERWYGAGVNHGVEKIERLEGNIMLLDLRAFPPPAMGAEVIGAAMNVVAQGDALVIDLRRNGGGAETVQLVMGHLVAPGSPFMSTYDRPSDRWTHETVPVVEGRRFGEDKPLYVLTSKRSFSAAEALAYALQAMGRATIVGETTGGGAHPFEYRKVSDHFALDLPEGRSEHPLTGTNWQDVGVKPDVAVPAADALDAALALARAELAGE